MSEEKDTKKQKNKKTKKIFKRECNECEEYKAGWLRAQADYKNLQKEVSEQRGQWARMSEQTILEDFIPVYDNFKLAFKNTDDADFYADDVDNADLKKILNWRQGIGYIMKQFGKVLEDHGVEEIKTVGEKFDPDKHEAAGEGESPSADAQDKVESGTILKEVSGGYLMKGKVIKVARVIVAK